MITSQLQATIKDLNMSQFYLHAYRMLDNRFSNSLSGYLFTYDLADGMKIHSSGFQVAYNHQAKFKKKANQGIEKQASVTIWFFVREKWKTGKGRLMLMRQFYTHITVYSASCRGLSTKSKCLPTRNEEQDRLCQSSYPLQCWSESDHDLDTL